MTPRFALTWHLQTQCPESQRPGEGQNVVIKLLLLTLPGWLGGCRGGSWASYGWKLWCGATDEHTDGYPGNSKMLVWRGCDWARFLRTTGLKQTNSTWESSWLYTCVWFRREICIVNINTIPITYKFFGHLVVWFHTAEYLLGVKWNMEFIITVNCRWGVHAIWLSGCQRHSGNEKEPPSEQMSCYGVFRTLSSGICDCHLRWQGTWFT